MGFTCSIIQYNVALRTLLTFDVLLWGIKAKGFYLLHYSIALRSLSLSHVELCFNISSMSFRFYIILDGSVGIYLDTKKDEKTTISVDNHTFPLPLPRRMSQLSISDKDGGEDLTTDRNGDSLGPSSSKGTRRGVSCTIRTCLDKYVQTVVFQEGLYATGVNF